MSTDVSTGGGREVGSTGGVVQSTGAAGSTGISGWGDDWRARMAAATTDPEKEAKQLERYESPEQIWKKARQFESRLSAGELKSVLPKGASPEEISRWRQENGIPAKPEEYKITMPAGQQPPKEDDAFLKAFLISAHGANFTQGQVDAAVTSFYAEVNRQTQEIAEAEKKAVDLAEDKLRSEWGGDYRTNKAMAEALLARAPAGFRDRFMNGYFADRTLIRADPNSWKWLVQMEREINPMARVMPGAGGDLGKTLEAEIADLQKDMRNPNSDYFKAPMIERDGVKDTPKAFRYRELISAQERMKAKSAA